MLNASEKGCTVRFHILCACIHFHGKITFFVACAKKGAKNHAVEHHLEALNFFLYSKTKQKDIFFTNLCAAHTYLRTCMREFSFEFFNTLKHA